ncbi:hypothetical protein C4K04_2602 [Pseudomonas chlororaphis]|uniref:Uncharacterized protein n=1 Tax=Pseudomonas chlororaphis TaxID=587753 RepID=A0A3G7TMD2_9PSED|nr:hypothetical protein C4K04_2602 [Pseudomonas chlororaphis]
MDAPRLWKHRYRLQGGCGLDTLLLPYTIYRQQTGGSLIIVQ